MKRDLRFDVTYPHPPEHVWRALTDADALRDWLMDSTFVEARVGHQFEFHTTPRPGFNGIVYCEVTAVDPPRRLAYTGRGGWKKKILRESLPLLLDRKMRVRAPTERVP